MAVSTNYSLWSPNNNTSFNIPASTAAMQDTVDLAILSAHNYYIGTRAQRVALTAPKLKKYLKFFETDYDIEWLYTGSGWKRIGGVLPGWTNLRTSVSFSSGWKYSASDASYTGIKARRINDTVEIIICSVICEAGKFNIPLTGNVENQTVFTGIPAQFRPASGDIASVTPLSAGGQFHGFIDASGAFKIASVQPWANQTASKAVNKRIFSGKATFFARNF